MHVFDLSVRSEVWADQDEREKQNWSNIESMLIKL